jgi:hypothetical protein
VIEQWGHPNLPISHWIGELNVDDPKISGDARNSHNYILQYGSDGYQLMCPRIGLAKKASSYKCNENTSKNKEAAI